MNTINLPLNLDFSAKIRWRMKRQRNPLFVILQDKYKVKEFAQERGVKTAPLLYVTSQPQSIPFDDLPSNYMIKANHGCGWNILCLESNLYVFSNGRHFVDDSGRLVSSKSAERHRISREEAIEICTQWLNQTYLSREWAYQQIAPKIVIEELLQTEDGRIPDDYRLYTFAGEVKAISMGSPVYRRENKNVFFTPEWTEIKLTKYKETVPTQLPQKPDDLQEMIRIAGELGQELDFVRVDLYRTQQGIVLGEMTIYPESGYRLSPTTCPAFNTWLGSQWKIGPIDSLLAFYWSIPEQMKGWVPEQTKTWLKSTTASLLELRSRRALPTAISE